jgi:uncharacterized protein
VASTPLKHQSGERMFVGEWRCSVGAWRVAYEEWEYCRVLDGACEVTPEGGAAQRFSVGEAFVLEPGFKGVWRVLEPMRKHFVVQIPGPA